MKKLLIGLLALTSLSLFSTEIVKVKNPTYSTLRILMKSNANGVCHLLGYSKALKGSKKVAQIAYRKKERVCARWEHQARWIGDGYKYWCAYYKYTGKNYLVYQELVQNALLVKRRGRIKAELSGPVLSEISCIE
ncbi:MAG: hypothetical protein N4A33_06870 [Bacteriovoracaceae bacterium]|jgi:hypothetical protein|nr:hypothetical protein [Bacteriovoracaceae bacterium]